MNIGARLRQTRLEAGLSQEKLGEAARVSKQTISQIESGQTVDPKASTLEPLSRRLGVQLHWLMTGRGEKVAVTASGSSASLGVQPVNETSTGERASHFQQLDPTILLRAAQWAEIFEANDGGGWTAIQRKRKEAEVYTLIVSDGGKLSDEHHAEFLQQMKDTARNRTGGGDERGKESAGLPAGRRVGGRG